MFDAELIDALGVPMFVEDDAGIVVARNAALVAVAERDPLGRPSAELLRDLAQPVDSRALVRGGRTYRVRVLRDARTAEVMERAQRMESLGRVASGVAHDFNNMLSIVLTSLDVVRRWTPSDAPAKPLIDGAIEAVERGAKLSRRLLSSSRAEPGEPAPTDAKEVVLSLLDLLRRSVGEAIEIETELAPAARCVVDRAELERAIVNLVMNARDAMPDGGILRIETREVTLAAPLAAVPATVPAGHYVRFGVRDTGVGIAKEKLSRVFEPFFSTKSAGHGTGLGLATVRAFAEHAGGAVTLESEEGAGTTVYVYLPVGAVAVSAPPSSRWDDEDVRGEGEHVLVVEDDRRLRHLVTELVRGLGYDVRSAASAAEALAIVNGGAPVDLLLADVVLGGTMSGQELAHVVRERRPGVVVVCMTGYGADELRARGAVDAGVTVLEKPFHVQALARALRAALLAAA